MEPRVIHFVDPDRHIFSSDRSPIRDTGHTQRDNNSEVRRLHDDSSFRLKAGTDPDEKATARCLEPVGERSKGNERDERLQA